MSSLKARNEYRDNVVFEGGSYPVPSSDRTFGLVVNENFAGLSSIPSTYVDTGCSPTFDGTKMIIGALTAGSTIVANRIEYNYYQNFESFYTEIVFTLNYTSSATVTRVIVGVLKRATGSNSFGNRSVAGEWRTDTSVGNARFCRVIVGTNANNYTTWNTQGEAGSKIVPVNGNRYKLTLQKSVGTTGSLYKSTLQDLSAGTSEYATWQEDFGNSSSTGFANAVSRPFIATPTGSIDILSWKFRGDDETNKGLLILGDSISHGLLASSYDKVWFKDFNNCAAATGPNNTTQDILDMIECAKAYKAKRVILFVGTNDYANSVANATWRANYTSIVEQLEANGSELILATALPRTGLTNINIDVGNWIRDYARSRGRKLIDFWSACQGAGGNTTTLLPDGTHPSTLMHSYMRDAAREVISNVR